MEPEQLPIEPKAPNAELQTPELSHPETPKLESKRRKNKKLIIALAVVLLLLVASLVYWFVIRKDAAPIVADNTGTQETVVGSQEEQPAPAKKINEVYYFYAEKSEGPYTLYRRPATGGERQELMKISGHPNTLATSDSSYIFSVDNDLWLGKFDGGQPKKIANFPNTTIVGTAYKEKGDFLVSIRANYQGAGKARIFSYSADGTGEKKVHEAGASETNVAYIILGYGSDKLAILPNCWDCDGLNNLNNAKTLDLNSGNLTDASPFDYFGEANPAPDSYRLGSDFKTIVYLKPTVDKSIPTATELGYSYEYYVGAPYALTRFNNDTKAETTLVGSLGEKKVQTNEGIKLPAYYRHGFFGQGSAMFFENKVMLPSAESVSSLHEFPVGESVLIGVYANDGEMIVGAAMPNNGQDQDVPVYYINLAEKKTTQIMKAPLYTTKFIGVSFK